MMTAEMHLDHGSTHTNRPSRIVIHAMAEFLEQNNVRDLSAYELLDRYGLSAHALITPSGVLIRCRNDDEGAYHAKGFNTDSLGVEFLVPGVHTYPTFLDAMKSEYVTGPQYASGLALVRQWRQTYGIPKEKISRHSDLSPGRKFDPGDGFPWERFLQEVLA